MLTAQDFVKEQQLQKIIDSAHVPAVSYACVLPNEDKTEFTSSSITIGKKTAQSAESETSAVDENTRFPASSLSKIVFTYLVLQLVKDKQIDLDEPLHDILPYERFMVDGEYPEKAKQITARHVLSHTTGLPNVEPNSSSLPTFDPESILGEGYSYSGEAFLYLQKTIEAKMGKDLETLAKEYVFDPLQMERSSFLPQPKSDTNIVKVHSEVGIPTTINEGHSELNVANAAGSLLTTANDFSKFIAAWLENIEDPIIKQAFQPTSAEDFTTRGTRTCGLGWHIYKNKDEVIAYQYGENFNTRSFVAINVHDKKAAVFFTNSKHGSSLANQIFNSTDLPSIGDLRDVYKDLQYSQSDEPGWQDTIAGKITEARDEVEEAGRCFAKALSSAPHDESKQRRLEWFNARHQVMQETKAFTLPLETFVGKYNNPHEEAEISIRDGGLIYKQFGHETKLVRVSETDFLPEKDQSFKLSIHGDEMSRLSIDGNEYCLPTRQPLPQSQLEAAREVTQHYRGALEGVKANNIASTAEETADDHKAPFPLKITLNPSGDQ